MRKLFVAKKTGFKNLNPDVPIIIRDIRGMMFYETMSIGKPVNKFNMPAGNYFVEKGSFIPMPFPKHYNLVTLPPKQRFKKDPRRFRIVLGNNPHKCSVIWDKDIILYDKSLYENSPQPVIWYIYGHELGHQFYKTEEYADLYSCNFMYRKGFNKTQIGLSPIRSLSDGQFKRKKFIIQKLTQ